MQIGYEVRSLEQFERGEVIEVEWGGKHGDEFELELKTRIAAIEGLGWIGFEGRRRGLDGRRGRWFNIIIHGNFCHDGLTSAR